MKRLLVSACALVLLGLATAPAARAQGVTTAAVAGKVQDESGAAVPLAELTLTNGATGAKYTARSRDDGRYSFEVVEVGGPYTLAVRALGFEPKTLDQFSLNLSQRLSLDVTLKRSAVEVAGVTVTANSDPRLSAARTGASTFISDTALHRLPTLNRSFTDFVNTSPQVAPGPNGRSMGGQNDRFNNIQIDGSVNNDLFALGSSTGVPGGAVNERPISLEAVQEYQIQIAPFDVRQGGFVGGLVNAVTKTGTNEFHGSIFGYMQNQSFVGSDTAGISVPVATYQQQQYGFSFGGPIIKDKLHFFATGDFRHDVRPFASFLQIGNSGASSDTAGIGITHQQADSVTHTVDSLGALYHVGSAGTWQAPTIPNPETNLFGKLDYELGTNSHLELSGTYVNANQITLIHKYTSPFNGRDGYELSNSGYNTQNQTRTVRGKWTATFGNNYSNEAILAYTTISDHRNPESPLPLILVHVNPTNFNDYVSAGAENFSQNNVLDQKSFEVTDNLTFSAGQHLITVGTHNEFFNFKNVFFPGSFGVWNFGNIDSLNLGIADRYTRALSTFGPLGPVADFSVKQFGAYAEDRFSPIANLTITAGLRMDVPSIPNPTENTNIDTIPLSSLGGAAIHTSNSPTGNMLWSPRLGFNYDVGGTQQTILRGGVGIFSGRPPYVWVSNAFGNTGVGGSSLTCTGQTGANSTPIFTADPNNQPTTCGGGGLPTTSAVSIVFYDPAFKFPQALKVAAGIDRQLGWGILGTADFIFTKSINQFYLQDVNLPGVATTATGEGGRPLYVQPTAFNAGTGAVSAARLTTKLGQAIENVNKSADRATQLTFQLQKRFDNGVEFNAAYTYSHVLDLFSYTSDISGSNFNFGALDGTIANRNLRTSVYDRPNKVSVSGTVNIPFDVRFSLIYTGISGTPFTYTVANDVNGDGVGGNDPVYVPKDASDIEMKNGAADYAKLDSYINGEPCLRDARGSLLQRDTCRNPWQNQLNARLSKVVPTFGGQSVEITVDMLNVLNFINSSWGLTRVTGGFEEQNLLRLSGYDAAAGRGIYTLSLPVKNAVSINSLGSRWVFQLGARYVF